MGDRGLYTFDWPEYGVFCAILGLSALTGIYFGFIKKAGQDTVSGYLFGGKQMTLLPVSMSLISSFTSGITLLGVPAEVYVYGTQYLASSISCVFLGILTAYVFIPVFYKLQYISLYEYLERRFDHRLRKVASIFFFINLMCYIPVVIYGPALAINQVSGINVFLVATVLCTICIFYTTVGGLKAVVWADTLQALMMILCVVLVTLIGSWRLGGFTHVFETAYEGGRIEFFNMDPDPTLRISFWSAVFGILVHWTGNVAVHPAAIQRFMSLPTMKQAKFSVIFLVLGSEIFLILSGVIGLVMYAFYRDCDPYTIKAVSRSDQMMPNFVLEVAGKYKGLAGMFLAGVVSAALSTMSTGLNTLAGVLYEDFIEPSMSTKVTEKKASQIIKCIVVILGAACVLFVLVIEKLGAILEISISFSGITTGTILGLFLLGILFPHATAIGAAVGGLTSVALMSWILIGARISISKGLIHHPTLPTSIKGCPFNLTDVVTPTVFSNVENDVFPLYKLSIFNYSVVGCGSVIIIGLIVSYLTGPNKIEDINPDLLSPVVHPFIPKSVKNKYQNVPLKPI